METHGTSATNWIPVLWWEVLRFVFCQAQPNPSSSWAELALFSLSPAYGLHNIAYGLHNIAYGLHNFASPGKVREACYNWLSQTQLELSSVQLSPSLFPPFLRNARSFWHRLQLCGLRGSINPPRPKVGHILTEIEIKTSATTYSLVWAF